MLDYLHPVFEDTPAFVACFDELPLWSAPFGLLLLEEVEMRHGMSVLDVGCGTGFPLLELAGRLGPSSRLVGLDPWRNALERARFKVVQQGFRNVELVEGRAEEMPFPDAAFDLVVSNLGINNVEDLPRTLAECRRVLRPEGRIAITTNLTGHWKEFYAVVREALHRVGFERAIPVLDEHERHRGTVASISNALDEAGFSVSRVIEQELAMRFLDGTAFLGHYFIRLGFMDAWKRVIPESAWELAFSEIEGRLNRLAADRGELRLTVPMAFIEGAKHGERGSSTPGAR
jgi:ubiquinone/menaquinone biosynthesis C-methylase UbiE